MLKRISVLLFVLLFSGAAWAASGPIKIAHIYDESGLLQAYGQQLQRGLELGFDYATDGTDKVLGRQIEIQQMDAKLNASHARALFKKAYSDPDVALAVGPISSGVSLSVLPIAKQYNKIILAEGVADAITGSHWNRDVFHIGRNSSQDAIAQAIAIGGKGVCAATVAQDYAFGHDGAAAFKTALENLGGKVVDEEFLPIKTTDFTAGGEKVINALRKAKNCPSGKYIFVVWAGGSNPFGGLAALNPEQYDIHITSGGNILKALALYKPVVGMEGGDYYYYKFPDNKVNDWFVKQHEKRYKSPPDFFTAQGFSEAQVIVAALKKAGSTNTDDLIKAMEGLKVETPKGEIYIRPQDHQALQNMYHFKVVLDKKDTFSGGVGLELVGVIKRSQMDVPIKNGR